MRTYIIPIVVLSMLVALPVTVGAQEENEDEEDLKAALVEQIEQLREMVRDLQAQVEAMHSEQQEIREENAALRRELREGMRGEDVETLQEVLATDSSIYPEGLVTGYYGPLTRAAVQRFRSQHNLGEGEEVDGEALDTINRLLEEGAGNSGVVPPGLLIAPGLEQARCRAGIGAGSACDVGPDEEEDENEDEEDEEEKKEEDTDDDENGEDEESEENDEDEE